MQIARNGFVISNCNKTIGFCKECLADIKQDMKIPGYDIHECACCGYPNSDYDLVETIEEGIFI